jgi:hypothetical protein
MPRRNNKKKNKGKSAHQHGQHCKGKASGGVSASSTTASNGIGNGIGTTLEGKAPTEWEKKKNLREALMEEYHIRRSILDTRMQPIASSTT